MSEPKKTMVEKGLGFKGQIMNKSIFPTANGEKFTLDIAVTGLRSMLPLGVSKEIFDSVDEGSPFHGCLSFSEYNGKMYFNHIAA